MWAYEMFPVAKYEDTVQDLSDAFAAGDLEKAKRLMIQLQYWAAIKRAILEWAPGKRVQIHHWEKRFPSLSMDILQSIEALHFRWRVCSMILFTFEQEALSALKRLVFHASYTYQPVTKTITIIIGPFENFSGTLSTICIEGAMA